MGVTGIWRIYAVLLSSTVGLRHGKILQLLNTGDDAITSVHTPRWIPKIEGRRKNESSPEALASFLTNQLKGPGRLNGYRLHRLNYIRAGYVVTQTIML